MLSVVIPARNVVEGIAPCLCALGPQVEERIEVVVAAASVDGTAELVESAFPWVRLLREPACSSLAELRAAGLRASHGEIVAFTDVSCRVRDDWIERLGHEPWNRYAAVGGVVAPVQRTRASEWAAFLCEYGAHLPSVLPGQAHLLPGNNIAFRRDALESAGLVGQQEFWKVFALGRLSELGEEFWLDPLLVVLHTRSTPTLEFVRQRYLHGRCYGANRAATLAPFFRFARAASCVLVPQLLTLRLIRAVGPHQEYRHVLLRSLHFVVGYHVAWAWGELHGYLRGRGNACAQLA